MSDLIERLNTAADDMLANDRDHWSAVVIEAITALSAPQPAPVAAEPQFHNVMRLLQAAQMEHGLCEPRSRRACTHCNAKDDLDALLKCYKGPPIRTATISPAQEGAAAEPIGWLFGSEGDGFKRGAQRPDERLSWQPLYTSPLPAQQGDVADERFEELLISVIRLAGLRREAFIYGSDLKFREHDKLLGVEKEALRQHFKQSRPAAPAQAMQEGITLNVQEVQAVALWAIAARQRGCVSDDDEFLVARLQSALSAQAGSEA